MKRTLVLLLVAAILLGALPAAAAPAREAHMPAIFDYYVSIPGQQLPNALALLRGMLGMQTDTNALMQDMVDEIFPGKGINYAADVAPWLGERILIGFNDFDDFVAVVDVTNPTAAQSFAQKLTQGGSTQFYAAIMVYISGDEAVTQVGDWLAYGTLNGVQKAIDAGDGSADVLSDDHAAAQLFAPVPANRILTAYMTGDAVQAALDDAGLDLSALLGTNSITGIAFAASNAPGSASALQFDLMLGFSEVVPAPVMSSPSIGSALAGALPQGTLGFFTAYDLRIPVRAGLFAFAMQNYIQGVIDAASTGAPPPTAPTAQQTQTLANGMLAAANLLLIQSGLSVNLETDILNWHSGEYAIGFLPNPAGLYGDQRILADVFAMTQVIDANASQNAVEVITGVLSSQLGLAPFAVNIDGYDLRAVSDPSTGGNLFVYGIVDDFLVFATGDGVRQLTAVANGSAPALADSAAWQQHSALAVPGSEGLLYFPVSAYVDYTRANLPADALASFEAGDATTLAPYDLLLASVDVDEDNRLLRVALLVKMK